MAPRHLKIYRGPEDHETVTAVEPSPVAKPCVTVPMGEVLPLLADAVDSQRTWLEDFSEDEITISADLYEVLMAYQYFRPVA